MGQRPWRGLMLASMLILLAIPVQADGDGIGIDAAQLPAFVDVDLTEEVVVHLQGFGVNGTATLHGTISDAEGAVVWSVMDNISLGDGDTGVLTLNVSTVPAGSQELNLLLSGHVLVSNTTHLSSATVSLQRDRPLSVGIVAASSDRAESLNGAGMPSGADPRDGERLAWFLTLRNDGDVDWNGTLQATFTQSAVDEIIDQEVNLSPMSTNEVVLSTATAWDEGPIHLNAVLLNVTDANQDDDQVEWNTTVAPPPLPLLALSLERQNTPEVPGDLWRHNMSLSNTGQAAWTGHVNCTWSDGSLHASVPVTVQLAETIDAVLEGTAKDGTLSCTAVGPRVDDASQVTVTDSLELSIAVFEVVAGGQPVPLDGPWDVGDDVRWSAVVRNIGTREGSVALQVGDGTDAYDSTSALLQPGEASELSLEHALVRAGDVAWSWSLISEDGVLVNGGGTANLLILSAPALSSSIDRVYVDPAQGHVVEWNLSLASSTSREVMLEVGHGVQGAWTWSSSTDLVLDANALSGSTQLGWIASENVAVRLTPVDWVHAGGPLLVTAETESTRAALAVLLKPTTVPVDPVAGNDVTLTVEVSNTGTAPSDPVTLRLVSSGEVLGTVNVKAIAPGGVEASAVVVQWPEGSPVGIEAVVVHDGERSVSQVSYEVVLPEASTSLSIPWSGLVLGVAGGLVLLTVEAIRRRAPEGEKKPRSSLPTSTSTDTPSSAPVEKVEVACPSCDWLALLLLAWLVWLPPCGLLLYPYSWPLPAVDGLGCTRFPCAFLRVLPAGFRAPASPNQTKPKHRMHAHSEEARKSRCFGFQN